MMPADRTAQCMLKIELPLHELLLYAHAFLIQATQTAKANGRSKIEERLARWLLMAHDRLEKTTSSLPMNFYRSCLECVDLALLWP